MVWQLQSVPVTAKDVSSNPAHPVILDTILCDKVWQWLATCRWFSLVSSISRIKL